MMKNYSLEIIDGLICSVICNITIFLGAAIGPIIGIYISEAVFGIYFLWRAIRYDSIKPFLVFLVSGVLFTVIGFVISLFNPLSYVLVTFFHPGYGSPSAVDGLGMLISLYFHAEVCIAISMIGAIKIMIKNRISSKKQME
ncbi:MAG: hypothetical protein K6F71_03450 [Ruminococcus sp.]|uniref:hypothetical protein n=1 Tax=Ruminococcus sp. TaxID=41978 RepID=UPI0025EBEF4A|nr:hypothetical protein [Ruminococcus sp.]MCR5539878.1 hypothetical protein [Ruminococcus sp.]